MTRKTPPSRRRSPGGPVSGRLAARRAKAGAEEDAGRKPRPSFQRQLFVVYGLSAMLVGLLLLYANGPLSLDKLAGAFGTGLPTSLMDDALRRSVVEELTKRDLRQMGAQRDRVAQLSRRYVGRTPSGSLRDIELLQELIDRHAVAKDDPWALQALGVTLGDVLAEQHDVEWVVVNDEYGRSRALQIGSDQDFVFPVTMIAKRVEAGHTVYVDQIYEKASRTIREVKQQRGI